MRRVYAFAPLLAALIAALAAAPVAAHEGEEGAPEEIVLEPTTVTAGGSVLLAGANLEPNSERLVVLAGSHILIEFGTTPTDADGRLSLELPIPGHLPAGVYQVRAIGDETLTAELQVAAAPGTVAGPSPAAAPAASPQPAAGTTPDQPAGSEPPQAVPDPTRTELGTVLTGPRDPLEAAFLVVVAGLLALVGLLLVLGAERVHAPRITERAGAANGPNT